MPMPKSRAELQDEVRSSYAALEETLEAAGVRAGGVDCVDGWSVKDLLAVRAWWTERVVDWVEQGLSGQAPVTPAEGFRWSETPQLNARTVRETRRESYRSIRGRLDDGYERLLRLIDRLGDAELLNVGAFAWAGKYPVSRWLSINTTRQYTTARTHIRRAMKRT